MALATKLGRDKQQAWGDPIEIFNDCSLLFQPGTQRPALLLLTATVVALRLRFKRFQL